jgi:hypothetical protein
VWAVKSLISVVPASMVDASGWEAGKYGSAVLERDSP